MVILLLFQLCKVYRYLIEVNVLIKWDESPLWGLTCHSGAKLILKIMIFWGVQSIGFR